MLVKSGPEPAAKAMFELLRLQGSVRRLRSEKWLETCLVIEFLDQIVLKRLTALKYGKYHGNILVTLERHN